MSVLVDTNIVGRLTQANHPQHETAKQAVRLLRQAQHELRIVPQVLYEFWSIATRKAEHNGLGLAVEETGEQLEQIKRHFPPFRDERGILENWEELVSRYQVKGKVSHDTRLVAAMQRHGIAHILTFNTVDFKRFSEVVAIAPDSIVEGAVSLPLE